MSPLLRVQLYVTSAPGTSSDTLSLALALQLLYQVLLVSSRLHLSTIPFS